MTSRWRRLIDRQVDRAFRRAADGQMAYFPFGPLSNGFRADNPTVEQVLRTEVRRFAVASEAVLLACLCLQAVVVSVALIVDATHLTGRQILWLRVGQILPCLGMMVGLVLVSWLSMRRFRRLGAISVAPRYVRWLPVARAYSRQALAWRAAGALLLAFVAIAMVILDRSASRWTAIALLLGLAGLGRYVWCRLVMAAQEGDARVM